MSNNKLSVLCNSYFVVFLHTGDDVSIANFSSKNISSSSLQGKQLNFIIEGNARKTTFLPFFFVVNGVLPPGITVLYGMQSDRKFCTKDCSVQFAPISSSADRTGLFIFLHTIVWFGLLVTFTCHVLVRFCFDLFSPVCSIRFRLKIHSCLQLAFECLVFSSLLLGHLLCSVTF